MPPITTLVVSSFGGLMSMLLPPQMSSAPCWNRKAKPTVSSTWRSTSLSIGRMEMRLNTKNNTMLATAATATNCGQLAATAGSARATAKATRMAMPKAMTALRRWAKPSERRNRRSMTRPIAATASAATGSDSAQDPVAAMTDSAM